MATRSFLFSLLAVSLLALTACQVRPLRRAENAPPPAPGEPRPEAVIEQPVTPTREEPKRVAVILGSGGAKAFAHVGVLKALQQERIPIEKIVGLEWGSLIAGIYAQKGQVHDVEWKLYKMEQLDLLKPKSKGFFSRNQEAPSIDSLDKFLGETFGKDDFSATKISFTCPSRSVWTGLVTWQNRGPLRDGLKRCLPFPPIFKVQGTFLAGASQATEAVEMLAKQGFNVIIMVNVLGSAAPVKQDALLENLNHVILWQEIRRALGEVTRLNVEMINVDTTAYPMVQFESKKELISLGEAVGRKAAVNLVSKYRF